MSAGQSLRKLRQDVGVTRAEVVAEADMSSTNYLKFIEEGRIEPTNLTFHNITSAIVRAHTKKAAAEATATASDQSNNDEEEARSK